MKIQKIGVILYYFQSFDMLHARWNLLYYEMKHMHGIICSPYTILKGGAATHSIGFQINK